MTIQEIIADFRANGAFFDDPTATAAQLDEQEAALGFKFPATYREAVTAGSYDKATFHFMEPRRDARDAAYMVFASWNDVLFGFHTGETSGDDEYRIYALGDTVEREQSYQDFRAWFEMVLRMSTRAVNPE